MNRESKIRLIACWALVATGWTGLAAAQAPKPGAEPLGRLFFTPAQRAQLDVARKQRARTSLVTEKAEEATAAPAPQTITYDGVVRRSDGKSTVFINRRPVTEKDSASGPVIVGRVHADGGVSLQIPQSGRAVELKPGQSIELLSGTIEEAYSRRLVAPEAKPAAAAKSTQTALPEAAKAERIREDDQQQQMKEALTRALQDLESGKLKPPPAAQTAAPPSETPR